MSNTNTLQSNIMKLQTLEAEYTVVLNQYKQAFQNYLQNLNSYKTTSSTYVALQGKTFWGTSGLKQENPLRNIEMDRAAGPDTRLSGLEKYPGGETSRKYLHLSVFLFSVVSSIVFVLSRFVEIILPIL